MAETRTEPDRVTRLAPSPTGGLHLGNARTFLINWAIARRRGWRIAFRIDDLDSPRVKPGADRDAVEDLRWLGLDWDSPICRQSDHLAHYQDALQELAAAGRIFPCQCTRSQIAARAASAPNEGDHELRYTGHCRPVDPQAIDFRGRADSGAAWRLRVEPGDVTFHDECQGQCRIRVCDEVGDFLIANKQGIASYQLAVNVDDHLQQVTDVIRGDDLLSSTARQMLIREALGMTENLRYWHLPLVVGKDGLRLAKRHCDTRIGMYRQLGVQPERLIGLIAHWSGRTELSPMSVDEFLNWFDIEQLSAARVTFSLRDDEWLRG
jgi:glutamyl-tRNA synthetase